MGDQVEESEEITVVGVEYKVLKHRRQKYRCRCNEQVMRAPGPAKLIPGGRYSVDFTVHVTEQKYFDHMPLERQVKAMSRAGLVTDSQTIWTRSASSLDTLSQRPWLRPINCGTTDLAPMACLGAPYPHVIDLKNRPRDGHPRLRPGVVSLSR